MKSLISKWKKGPQEAWSMWFTVACANLSVQNHGDCFLPWKAHNQYSLTGVGKYSQYQPFFKNFFSFFSYVVSEKHCCPFITRIYLDISILSVYTHNYIPSELDSYCNTSMQATFYVIAKIMQEAAYLKKEFFGVLSFAIQKTQLDLVKIFQGRESGAFKDKKPQGC